MKLHSLSGHFQVIIGITNQSNQIISEKSSVNQFNKLVQPDKQKTDHFSLNNPMDPCRTHNAPAGFLLAGIRSAGFLSSCTVGRDHFLLGISVKSIGDHNVHTAYYSINTVCKSARLSHSEAKF